MESLPVTTTSAPCSREVKLEAAFVGPFPTAAWHRSRGARQSMAVLPRGWPRPSGVGGTVSRLYLNVVLARRRYIRDQNCCSRVLVTSNCTQKLAGGCDAALQHIGAEYSL